MQSISFLGNDNIYIEGIMSAVDEVRKWLPSDIQNICIAVFSGMTLADVSKKFGHGFPQGSRSIVVCTANCMRMLKGTSGYNHTIFVDISASVTEFMSALIKLCNRSDVSPETGDPMSSITERSKGIINAFVQGWSIDDIATLYRLSDKSAYRHIEQMMHKLGTHSRQELYLKWLLLTSAPKM